MLSPELNSVPNWRCTRRYDDFLCTDVFGHCNDLLRCRTANNRVYLEVTYQGNVMINGVVEGHVPSTRSTTLSTNSKAIAFSFRRTFFRLQDLKDSKKRKQKAIYLICCPGIMNVRPTYRFLIKPSRYGSFSFCARFSAATREVSGT